MSVRFQDLNLAQPLLDATEALGFTSATPVQEAVFPAAMAGGDLMVSSQTGSGKTAAFLLPILQKILEGNPNGKPVPARAEPQVLVLCPTRELAQQVTADAIELVKFTKGIRIATIMGGMPYGKQIAQVRGATIVVATPGRLLDLNDSRAIRLDKVKQLIVDEADRMLDLGFADDLEAIHSRCEIREQTLMFSATFAPRIMELASNLMNDPTRIELAHAGDVHSNITQTMHWADNMAHKHKLLNHWLSDPTLDQAVVFASTQIESENIAEALRADGHEASALHGAMPQAVRSRRLDSLRKGTTKILVATDVAARGIDVPTISHVINFGLPMKPEDYTHRIGRTGRAGRNGVAITIAQHSERVKIRAIERFTQQTLTPSIIPGLEPTEKARSGGGNGRPGAGRSGGGRSGGFGGGRSGGFGGGRSSGPRFAGQSDRPAPSGEFGGGQRQSSPSEFGGAPKPAYNNGGDKKYGKGQRSEQRFSAKPEGGYREGGSREGGSREGGYREGGARESGSREGYKGEGFKSSAFGDFSKGRSSKPSGSFAKPAGSFAKPAGSFSKPAGSFGKPSGSFGKPSGNGGGGFGGKPRTGGRSTRTPNF
jgi:superfamily II DNA/RNA helicase